MQIGLSEREVLGKKVHFGYRHLLNQLSRPTLLNSKVQGFSVFFCKSACFLCIFMAHSGL